VAFDNGDSGGMLSAGGFANPGGAAMSRSATNLAGQHFEAERGTAGFLGGGTLTRGFRSTPPYQETGFSQSTAPHPMRNLSAGQFGSGSARDTMEEEEEE
jgi:hypothetical protein